MTATRVRSVSKVPRWLLVAVAAIIVSAALFVLVLSQLRGPRVREVVEQRLSAILGQPVSIGELGISVRPFLSVSGEGLRIGRANIVAPALEIDRIVVKPRLGSLLRGSVVVEDVELRGFVVSVVRDADGRWEVPAVVPAAGADAGSDTSVERVRILDGRIRIFTEPGKGDLQESSSIDAIETSIAPTADGLRLSPIEGRIGDSTIRGEARTTATAVHLQFTADAIDDDDLPALLGLLGTERPDFLKLADPITVTTSLSVDRSSARLSGTGTLQAPQVLLDTVNLQRLESPFTIEGDRLQFSPVAFAVSGGAHTGVVTMRFEPARWAIDSRVAGLNVDGFLDALSGSNQPLEGTGTVNARLTGRVDQSLVESASGRLELTVEDGVIRGFPLLAAIDRAMKLTEQQEGDTAFERMTGTFDVSGGSARTSDLVVRARDVRLAARGRIGADRSLDMRGVAVLSPERSARAITSINELKGMRNERGEIEIPLTISGSLDAPSFQIDLASILEKGALDELKRRLRRIIR